MATTSFLSPTQRYAAGALFAIALHQAQIHQSRPLGLTAEEDSTQERTSSSSSSDSVSEDPELWVHENSGLLRPVFRFLSIDSAAWPGLEETAASSPPQHHVGAFLRLLAEEGDDSSQSSDQELALAKAVDVTVRSLETNSESSKNKKEKHEEYKHECLEKCSLAEVESLPELANKDLATQQGTATYMSGIEGGPHRSGNQFDEKPFEEKMTLSYQRKVECREKCSTAEVESLPLLANKDLATQQDSTSNISGIEGAPYRSDNKVDEKPLEEEITLSYRRKVDCHEKFSTAEVESLPLLANKDLATQQDTTCNMTGIQEAPRRSDDKFNEKPLKEEMTTLTNQRKVECHEKCATAEVESLPELENKDLAIQQDESNNMFGTEGAPNRSDNKFDEKPLEEEMTLSYQRKVTVLYELLSACLADVPEDNKKDTQRRKGYDARHRVVLRLLATWLDIKWTKMEAIEMMVACSAMALRKAEESEGEENRSPKSKWAKWKRGGIIGAAALTGGTLMAITGGLAAPAIAAGFGALAPTLGTLIPVIGASGFAAAASAAGTVAGSVAVAASFGAAGAGLTGSKMARRTGSVDEFEFKPIGENSNQGRLAVEILISGLVFNEDDFIRPWEGKNDNMERYALQWESKNLIAVSTAIQDWLTSRLALGLMKQGAMMTVLSSLMVALAWPATLVAAADLIDSKWTIAVNRSDKAGRLLAGEVLLKGLQGNRPVTLIGYSLGARVIFKCLEYLAENECNAGLVERVVLLGAPISIKDQKWEAVRKMVAGRFVNAYSTNDWMLAVAFRASLLTQGLAGIQPIDVPGIENVNVTHLIQGHSSYLWATKEILDQLELDTYYPAFRSNPGKQ